MELLTKLQSEQHVIKELSAKLKQREKELEDVCHMVCDFAFNISKLVLVLFYNVIKLCVNSVWLQCVLTYCNFIPADDLATGQKRT